MEPIISPWLIYFASRADAVGTLFLIVAVAAFAICLIGFDDLTKNGFKLFISIGIISVILTVLTPTTETVYPVEFIGDPVLEENIPKMLSVVREYIKEYESYLTFKTKIGNTVWDSEKLKYGNIAYEHQERADKLAEKMNEGISPYFWYVGKVSENVVFNEISRKVDYAVCLEKMI